MVSIRDVAAKAGVSHQTVSNYINSPSIVAEKTRVRIKQAIEELGYRPNAVARRLKTGRSDLIAIGVAASEQRKQSLIFDEFLHLLSYEATKRGRHIMLYPRINEHEEIKYFSQLCEQSDVDAIIVDELTAGKQRSEWLMDSKVPFAVFGRVSGFSDEVADSVTWHDTDGYSAVKEITASLIAQGKKRIGYIGWKTDTPISISRETAWEDAYLESGIVGSGEKALKELESWKMEVEESMCDGVRAFKELLNRHPDIEAVVCASDNLAAGILMAVGSAKIRGCTLTLENFCVTGFDDSEVAKAMKFTSVKQPLAKIAELTVSSLVDKIEGKTPSKDETKTHLIKPEIIWRNTFANMT